MRIAKVTGTVTATAKDAALVGSSLLIVDYTDAKGKTLEPAHVAIDSVGAGVGQMVLVTSGSAARLPQGKAGQPIDAVIVAIVDQLSLS